MISVTSKSKQNEQTEIIFNSSSLGYKAVFAAAHGQLKILKETLVQDRECLNALHVVTAKGDRFTPTHYGLARRQFKAVAFLLNQGVAWTISSQKSEGKGSTAIEMLNKIENGLCALLQSLVDSEDPINLSALVSILTSPYLAIERRREVLNNPELRWNLCKKLNKEDALFIMGTLLIGSHVWKGMKTDFPHYLLQAEAKEVFSFNKTMCCNQMVIYASILTGRISPKGAQEFFQANIPTFEKKDHDKLLSPFTTDKERTALMLPFNQCLSRNLGLVERGQDNLLDLKTPHRGEPLTQIFYVEVDKGMIEHYGILHRNENGNFLIHMSQRTNCIVLEDAATALKEEGRLIPIKAIYTGMLPMHQ